MLPNNSPAHGAITRPPRVIKSIVKQRHVLAATTGTPRVGDARIPGRHWVVVQLGEMLALIGPLCLLHIAAEMRSSTDNSAALRDTIPRPTALDASSLMIPSAASVHHLGLRMESSRSATRLGQRRAMLRYRTRRMDHHNTPSGPVPRDTTKRSGLTFRRGIRQWTGFRTSFPRSPPPPPPPPPLPPPPHHPGARERQPGNANTRVTQRLSNACIDTSKAPLARAATQCAALIWCSTWCLG